MKDYNKTQTNAQDTDQQEKQGSKGGQANYGSPETNDMNQDKSQVHDSGL